MPRKTATKSNRVARQSAPKAGAPITAKRTRARAGEVPARILEALASGPKSRPQLQTAAGCSTASLYLHLKALRTRGQIVIAGRRTPVALAKASAATTGSKERALPVLKPKPTTAMIAAPVYVAGPLHDALEAVALRFEAPERIGEKLHTLEQLARTMPTAVAEVLTAIHTDLLRLSPGRRA